MMDLLLRKAIFFHEDGHIETQLIPVTSRLKANLANVRFRNRLAKKITAAKKNMSGQAGQNLKKLYTQLNLDTYAIKLIDSGKWHLMARGIQQIGTMELKEYLKKIYRFTDDKNELVRAEAQIAVLNLSGFEGLRFLDLISYRISEWQQMKLLNELSAVPHVNLSGIDNWLKSDNPSVVAFALKLVRNYHHFELYNDIVNCLEHPEPNVRIQAVYTLIDIFTEDTSKKLLDKFSQEAHENQFAILKAVKKIGDDADLPKLQTLLCTEDFEMKLEVVRAMANISEAGLELLENDPQSQVYPLNEMLTQIKSEIKR
ncbi:HEAT repeat domain-containing protein [Pedobacter frigoris]|uniref:HEAT repeat domain-containing protein n=1 Tax=Pedobacter frigoris TaxID=2571272 RepID=UPI0029308CCD|nr:HEAT repeat domain-containing protein [Pedobacter frigoris]